VIYQTARRRVNKEVSKNQVVSERFCKCKNEMVFSETPSCSSHFVIAQYFWCERSNHWQHILACINQKKKDSPICQKCPQCEEEIFEIAAGRNLHELFGIQRRTIIEEAETDSRPKLKLKIRNEESESKPKLKLRSEDDSSENRNTGSG
jgi:hypothetical protein